MLFASIALSGAMNAAASDLVAAQKTPGVQYAVVESGKIVDAGAAGRADLASGTPVTNETRFRIGSITKMFTAVAVMQLVEAGKLSLDETLDRFQPSFGHASSITVRDLLMHRSGIPDYLDPALASGAVKTPVTPQAIADSMSGKPLLSRPGTAFSYSNTNYVLLGLIVQRLAGVSLHDYYREKIFLPAGMTETSAGDVSSPAQVAVGYASPGARPSVAEAGDMSWYFGCGDALSTASDLARFDVALMDDRLLEPATLAGMVSAAMPSSLGKRVGYGLGVATVPVGVGDPLVGHHGGMPGFAGEDEMLLSERFAIVSLGNDTTYPSYRMNNAVFAALYPQRLAALQTQAAADAKADAANEDVALTARFSAFFRSVLSGTLDPAGLSDAMVAAFTPAAVEQVKQHFAQDGALQSLRYVSQDTFQGYRRYHYTATFTNDTQPLTFVLNASGKIDGFFLQ
jgi:D-alanyl-D-alanine carboxypeptidase